MLVIIAMFQCSKFERIPDLTITDTLLKAIIVQALLDLHGEVCFISFPICLHLSLIQYGAAIVVEVLEYKELTKKSYSFIIKIPARWVGLLSTLVTLNCDSNLVKVWSSLTLLGCYNGVATMFLIHQVSKTAQVNLCKFFYKLRTNFWVLVNIFCVTVFFICNFSDVTNVTCRSPQI